MSKATATALVTGGKNGSAGRSSRISPPTVCRRHPLQSLARRGRCIGRPDQPAGGVLRLSAPI